MENQVKKLNSDELEKIINIKKEVDLRQLKVGELEFLKTNLILEINKINEEFIKIQNELSEKYGNIEIDLSSGEIKQIEEKPLQKSIDNFNNNNNNGMQ